MAIYILNMTKINHILIKYFKVARNANILSLLFGDNINKHCDFYFKNEDA